MEALTLNKSQIRLRNAAKDLFWKYGIRKVTVEEICKEAGVSKMTFYRHFKSKLEVVEIVIDEIILDSRAKYKALMGSNKPFDEKFRMMVQLKKEGTKGISKEFVTDLIQIQDWQESKQEEVQQLGQKMKAHQQTQMQMFMADMAEAQKQGYIRSDVRMDFIIYLYNDIVQKMLDPVLNSMYDNEEDLIMELTNYFFYGIMERK
jgi:AcrR family transcriptional regulator